jgi:phosphate transport system protein
MGGCEVTAMRRSLDDRHPASALSSAAALPAWNTGFGAGSQDGVIGRATAPKGAFMHEHIVKAFDQELQLLDKKIAQMGGLAERLLAQGFNALERRDPKLAEAAVASDRSIDMLERELQEQTILMIAKRQPVANDLRHIMTVLKVAGDLERIGDLAKNIAKRALAVSGENHPKSLMLGLKHMTELAMGQLNDVLDAFAERDAEKALAVWRHDERIDAMFNSLFRELLTYMMEDPRNIGLCTHLLFGAKNIERIGDHTTNIAENVYFLVNGSALSDDRPKGDDTSMILIRKE